MLDTGPLMDLVLLEYLRGKRGQILSELGKLVAVRTPYLQGQFLRCMRSGAHRLVTSHAVMVELHRKVQVTDNRQAATRLPVRRDCWELALRLIEELGLTVEEVPFLDLDRVHVLQGGPVDAGLLYLARRCVGRSSGPVILVTIERALRRLCRNVGIGACHPDELTQALLTDGD